MICDDDETEKAGGCQTDEYRIQLRLASNYLYDENLLLLTLSM